MDEVGGLLILAVVVAVLCGPVALAVSLAALRRIREVQEQLAALRAAPPVDRRAGGQPRLTPISAVAPPAGGSTPVETAPTVPAAEAVVPPGPLVVPTESLGGRVSASGPEMYPRTPDAAAGSRRENSGLEQWIGTRWALVAGVITIIFAVGFFLKHAYESGWIGPLGRVLIAAAAGVVALTIGEGTRRRGYDFVAEGVTALGFAIFYATVFAAHRWYGLLGPAPAYVLATGVTAAAMLYAVVLDEVTVAVLSLIGGYVTPVVLSRGENLPTLLFSYVLILSAGAVLCAYWRMWSSVNLIAFAGTYLLYTGWWWRFYRPALDRGVTPQLGIALFWLFAFFFVYLLVPLVHTLVRRVRSQLQEAVLVLVNGGVVLYYLATMLMDRHQNWLALASLLMGASYLGLAVLAFFRCPADANLRMALLLTGWSFISLAVPLYFQANATAVVWTVEAFALAAVGLRYRSLLLQMAAGGMAALSLGALLYHLPEHTTPLRPVFNATFGTWFLVAVAFLAAHVLYRMDKHLALHTRHMIAQALYAVALLLLMFAIGTELWDASDHRTDGFFPRQMVLVFGVFLLLFVARPLPPRGALCPLVGTGLGLIGSVFLLVVYSLIQGRPFPIFLNVDFARALMLVAALFSAAWLAHRDGQRLSDRLTVASVLGLVGILVLWLVVTQEIWAHYRLRHQLNWRFPAHMYISVSWALYASVLMVIGLWWRNRPVRYLGLWIFLLLLVKIFFVDTQTLGVTYRIAGFLATGLALVGVSYLYQYLKKMGFFDSVPPVDPAAPDRRRTDNPQNQ